MCVVVVVVAVAVVVVVVVSLLYARTINRRVMVKLCVGSDGAYRLSRVTESLVASTTETRTELDKVSLFTCDVTHCPYVVARDR